MASRIGMTCTYYNAADAHGVGPHAAIVVAPNSADTTVALQVFYANGDSALQTGVPIKAVGLTRYWTVVGGDTTSAPPPPPSH